MYWRDQPKQLGLNINRQRICPACRAIDPPTEPAYGCPECGEGGTLCELGGSVPEVCPWCGDGKLELITEDACGVCGQTEMVETEVFICPWCGEVVLPRYERHGCPNRPRPQAEPEDIKEKWTEGGDGKVAYLRLECRAKEERVRVMGSLCPGWRKLVERFEAGDKEAFRPCAFCAYGWGKSPGRLKAIEVEPYPHQTALKL